MLSAQAYPSAARLVFFGHYWLSGDPFLQPQNALCHDCSADKDGPLVSYDLSDPAESLSNGKIRVHPSII